ncbi:MAG: tetratricopeptide repeat protein [bacterium]
MMGIRDTKRFIAILALSSFAFFPAAGRASEQAIGHFESGIASFDRGDYAQALESFGKAVEEKPDFAQAYYNIGIIYDQQQRFSDAIEAYKKVLDIDPNTALVFENLAMDSYLVGNVEDAMYYANLAESRGRLINGMLYNQIRAEYMKKAKGTLVCLPGSAPGPPQVTKEQLESEIAGLEKTLQAQEATPDVLLELGVRYRQVGSIDKAIEILNRARELNGNNPQIYAELAACYFLDDQQSLFVTNMKKARKIGYRPSESLRDLQAQTLSTQ